MSSSLLNEIPSTGDAEEDTDTEDLPLVSRIPQMDNLLSQTLKKWRLAALVLDAYSRYGESSNVECEPVVGHSETGNSYHIDNNKGVLETHERRNTGANSRKVDVGWIFVITNFLLELPSAVFDQLSSVYKPQYALISMLMSFTAMLLCMVELIYKARKEKFSWRWRGKIPWFYHSSSNHKPFGSFKDIIGLACALCQCLVTTINYGFFCLDADNPIKISLWPIIFAFGLLCSKFFENPDRRTSL